MNEVGLSLSWWLMLVAFMIASFGSATALEAIKQRTGTKGKKNWLLLLSAAFALGGVGIWSMHFIAILALQLKIGELELSIYIDPGLTVLSFFISCLFVFIGIYICGDINHLSYKKLIGGGVITGSGVSAMHYIGMLAMRMQASVSWSPGLVFLSCLIGIIASTVAFWIFFNFQKTWNTRPHILLLCALLMGVAVTAMHVTGQFACSYTYRPDMNVDGFVDVKNLIYVVVPLAFASGLLLLLTLYYVSRYNQAETKRRQYLNLSLLIVDEHNRVLCDSITHSLPNVTLDELYIGRGNLCDPANRDFLMMFRTSFHWNTARLKLQEADAALLTPSPPYSLKLYAKFLRGALKMASEISFNYVDLGIVYLYPTLNTVTLVSRTQNGSDYTKNGYRWSPLSAFTQTDSYRAHLRQWTELQRRDVVPLHRDENWIDSMLEFYGKCIQAPERCMFSPLTIYVGLIYVRVTAAMGTEILMSNHGPYHMIPMVLMEPDPRFLNMQNIATVYKWLISSNPATCETACELALHTAYQSAVHQLACDTGRDNVDTGDLIPANTYSWDPVLLGENTALFPFVISTMSPDFPSKYDSSLYHFIPFTLFEVIHTRQYPNAFPARWLHTVIESKLQVNGVLNLLNNARETNRSMLSLQINQV